MRIFMANGFQHYLKETQNELHHVAWPTREQTIIYTVLVAAISIGLSLYLGLFDYIFTTGLTRAIGLSGVSAPATPDIIVSTSSAATTTETTDAPASSNLNLNLGDKQQ
jgi:preprotein translocase SecE subunit